jgi:hypothetical protein
MVYDRKAGFAQSRIGKRTTSCTQCGYGPWYLIMLLST